ncbi:MAG: hypothetical protein ACRD1F_10000, partial [Terriglobales bacterium]
MWSALRRAISNQIEALLRWLTASVIRSTAIFLILTFVPILLLTYYIVATSIRNTKAAQAGADQQVAEFSVSLLKADFRSEREALAGAADETSLQNLLAASLIAQSRSARDRKRQQHDFVKATQRAARNLARLRARRTEFVAIALYRADGSLLATAPVATARVPDFAPAAVPAVLPSPAPQSPPATRTTRVRPPPPALVPRLQMATLPPWFHRALAGATITSAALPASDHWPRRLAFAVPVSFSLPPHAPGGAASTG